MEVFLGFFASLVYLLWLVLICRKYRAIQLALVLGALTRLVLCWVNGLRIVALPGASGDAIGFERRAREWSELPWNELLALFDPSNSFVISVIAGMIYKITGPSPVLLNVINAAVSVWLIILTYRIAKRLFGPDRARAAAWIVALFPYAILYGSVYLREVFGSLFFMFALLRAMDWARSNNPLAMLSALLFFVGAALFHGSYLFGAVGVLLFALVGMLRNIFRSGNRNRLNRVLSGALAAVFLVSVLIAAMAGGVRLNNLGQIDEFSAAEAIEARVLHRVSEGGSSYPDVLRGVNPFSSPIIFPGRIIYFTLSPFPWDIRAPIHVLGFSATIYFFLIMRSILGARRIIIQNREALVVLFATMVAFLVFAIAIDNIGTSIRHRTKFVYPLAALCASPLFHRFRVRMGAGLRSKSAIQNEPSAFNASRGTR